jgi:hypothetical protein
MIDDDVNLFIFQINDKTSKKMVLDILLPFSKDYKIQVSDNKLSDIFSDYIIAIVEYKSFLFLITSLGEAIYGDITHQLFKKLCVQEGKNCINYMNSNTVSFSCVDIRESGKSIRHISENTGVLEMHYGEDTQYEIYGKYPRQVLETYIGFPLSELNNVLYDVVILKN